MMAAILLTLLGAVCLAVITARVAYKKGASGLGATLLGVALGLFYVGVIHYLVS